MSDPRASETRYPSRRDFLALGLGAFVIGAVPLAARRREKLVRRSLPVMGTVAEIAVVHQDGRYAQNAIDAAFAEMIGVDRTMSRFRTDSDVGRVNGARQGMSTVVSGATALVVAEALRWADASKGRFDPALARVTALWDVGHRTAPPPASEVRRFAGKSLYREVEVDTRGSAAFIILHQDEIGLDLGGIAKGFAVDRAVDALRSWGIRHALVNAGGDLHALGRSPEGDPWHVGVRSPDDPTGLAATLLIEDEAIATSGDYLQFFDHAGRRYHHLIDPRTGEPRHSPIRSLTVTAATCMAADAAATTLFGCSSDDAARILAAADPTARISHQV